MKFLPKSKTDKLTALIRTYSAPSVLIKFSEIFNSLKVLFFFKGIEIISAPLIPISLSYKRNTYKVLFCNKIAAKQRAPSIPKEFLRIEPYSIPKSKHFMCVFFINYYRIRERPTSLIILLARLRLSILVPLIIFLTACIPYSLIELSDKLRSVKLHTYTITHWPIG